MTGLPEMPCQEFVERVTDYLEGALSPTDRARLEEHLAECESCALYLDQLRTTRRLAGELRTDDVTREMRSSLMLAFARWQDEGAPTSPTDGPRPEPGAR